MRIVPNLPPEPTPRTRYEVLGEAIQADTEEAARSILAVYAEERGYKPGWTERMVLWVNDRRNETPSE